MRVAIELLPGGRKKHSHDFHYYLDVLAPKFTCSIDTSLLNSRRYFQLPTERLHLNVPQVPQVSMLKAKITNVVLQLHFPFQ